MYRILTVTAPGGHLVTKKNEKTEKYINLVIGSVGVTSCHLQRLLCRPIWSFLRQLQVITLIVLNTQMNRCLSTGEVYNQVKGRLAGRNVGLHGHSSITNSGTLQAEYIHSFPFVKILTLLKLITHTHCTYTSQVVGE